MQYFGRSKLSRSLVQPPRVQESIVEVSGAKSCRVQAGCVPSNVLPFQHEYRSVILQNSLCDNIYKTDKKINLAMK